MQKITLQSFGLLLFGASLLGGCATKTYHITAPLSDARANELTCHELALEMAEIDEIAVKINEEAKTDIRSVGAVIADFGIGNSIAKGKATKALSERRSVVSRTMALKNCLTGPAPAAGHIADPAGEAPVEKPA